MKSGISFIARQQNINHSFYLWAMLSPRAARSEDSGLKKPGEKGGEVVQKSTTRPLACSPQKLV